MAMSARIALSNASRGEDLRRLRALRPSPSRRRGGRPSRPSRGAASRARGSPRCRAASCRAPRAIDAIVDAVPITMQWPFERDMHDSASPNSSSVRRSARRSAQSRQLSVPEPRSSCASGPRSIGPPVTMIAGTSADAAPISIAGVVLSQPESSTTRVERIRADALLDVHRHQVAEQHRGGLHQDLAERDRRELEGEAARAPHAALHRVRDAGADARCSSSARTTSSRCR